MRRFPSKQSVKEGYLLLENHYFTVINSSSVKTVADRHRLVAYRNKDGWRAFRRYQHRWPWTTLNSKIGGFGELVAISGCGTHFKSELRRNHWRLRQPTYEIFSIRPPRLDFNSLSFDPLGSRSPAYGGVKLGYPLQKARFLLLFLLRVSWAFKLRSVGK